MAAKVAMGAVDHFHNHDGPVDLRDSDNKEVEVSTLTGATREQRNTSTVDLEFLRKGFKDEAWFEAEIEFIHELHPGKPYKYDPSKLEPCKYFLDGRCFLGDACQFLHDLSPICGLCDMTIQEPKLFGLLTHCDDTFCLDCIRKWKYGEDNATHYIICPTCNVKSHLILPSRVFARDLPKSNMSSRYKQHMALLHCPFFDMGNRRCPTFPDCLFAHIRAPKPPKKSEKGKVGRHANIVTHNNDKNPFSPPEGPTAGRKFAKGLKTSGGFRGFTDRVRKPKPVSLEDLHAEVEALPKIASIDTDNNVVTLTLLDSGEQWEFVLSRPVPGSDTDEEEELGLWD